MSSLLSHAVALPFRLASTARGARSLHPDGFRATGRWSIDTAHPLAGDAAVLQPGYDEPVVARISRSVGLPEQVGDIFGFALRVEDAHGPGEHQDLLFATTYDLPGVHMVFLPAVSWWAAPYSTCLPFDGGAGSMVIGLRWPEDGPRPGPSHEAMRAVVGEGLTMDITIAAPLGRFERIGSATFGDPYEDSEQAPRFNPWNCGGGLRPVGLLNRLRDEAYRKSRAGRGVPES